MCKFFFFPDRHYYRKLWSFLLLPCISICLLLTLLHTHPPRVRFLHPSHQSLCSQSDLKTADSCWSCVCSSFRKMYSPWNQATLDAWSVWRQESRRSLPCQNTTAEGCSILSGKIHLISPQPNRFHKMVSRNWKWNKGTKSIFKKLWNLLWICRQCRISVQVNVHEDRVITYLLSICPCCEDVMFLQPFGAFIAQPGPKHNPHTDHKTQSSPAPYRKARSGPWPPIVYIQSALCMSLW